MKDNNNQSKKSIRDLNLEELKKFIASAQQTQKEEKVFKPERLQQFRRIKISRPYTTGLSS